MDNPSESISAAAHAYQAVMDEGTSAQPPAAPKPEPIDSLRDVAMADSTPERAASPAILPGATVSSPSVRTGTPSRTNGHETSRATSQHPDPTPHTIPKEAPPHGAPTRQFLNSKVTGPLLEGMKFIAKEQPRDPLRVLGEFLLQKSREIEGT